MEDKSSEEDTFVEEKVLKPKKKKPKVTEPGIIYLSRIPTLMNVKKLRHILNCYGETGRIFLQPDEKSNARKKKNRQFSEGWVEFMDKKIAKQCARTLNANMIGGKRRNPWYEELWNMKYLSKFKWAHLNERLAYERAVHKQRLRTEVAQVKKETTFYIQNVEKRKFLEKKAKKQNTDIASSSWTFEQKLTEDEVLSKKRKSPEKGGGRQKKQKTQTGEIKKAGMNAGFLKSLFSGGNKDEEGESRCLN